MASDDLINQRLGQYQISAVVDGTDSVVVLQARLPNGVAIDMRGVELRHIGEVIEAFGRLACSVSTTG